MIQKYTLKNSVVSFRLTSKEIESLKAIVRLGKYKDVSEAMRAMIKDQFTALSQLKKQKMDAQVLKNKDVKMKANLSNSQRDNYSGSKWRIKLINHE